MVFTSGFAAGSLASRGPVIRGARFLPKPFSIDAMIQAVDDATDARCAGAGVGAVERLATERR